MSISQVCVCVCARRVQLRPRLCEKHPPDNEILTYTLSARLSTWTLDEFLRKSRESRAEQARPLSRRLRGAAAAAVVLTLPCCYCCCFLSLYYNYLFSKAQRAIPRIFSAVEMCAHWWCAVRSDSSPLIDGHIQLPFRPLLYSTPPQASPWQSEPTCQSTALIIHWDGFHFNAFLPPTPPLSHTHTHGGVRGWVG